MQSSYPALCFGELLWDLLPSGDRPGGAPMNVAFHLKKQGLNPAVISRVGDDERGKTLLQLAQGHGLPVHGIQIDETHPTGIVHARQGPNHEMQYVIEEPVAWDYIAFETGTAEAAAKAGYFVFGSLAARSPTSRQTLLALLEAASLPVCDINLRPPHYSSESLVPLLQKAAILKLNEEELSLIASWLGESTRPEDQARRIQDRYRIPLVLVTRGSAGAFLCREGAITRHAGYRVRVADTVGSGDAFLAGFLSRQHQGKTDMESLRFANALGATVAARQGAWPDYSAADVDRLMRSVGAREDIL